MNAIFTRRSIRDYLDQPVEKEKIKRLLRAAMQAPSAHNRQPWEFLVVTDREAKAQLAAMSPYAKPAEKAPCVIVVLANENVLDKNSDIKWWPQDLGACTQNILLQAVEEGLGAVWMGFYPRADRCNAAIEFLRLPEGILPFCLIAVGYGKQENHFTDRFQAHKIHYEQY